MVKKKSPMGGRAGAMNKARSQAKARVAAKKAETPTQRRQRLYKEKPNQMYAKYPRGGGKYKLNAKGESVPIKKKKK
jgi:hypothetical protein